MSIPNRNRAYLLLAFAGLLVFTSFQSISLDDFDSFSFAFALERPERALFEVQPPGFPVYLAAGQVFYALTGDSRLALTLLSAISGASGLVFTAWIADGLGQRRAGVIAGGLLLFLPGYWLHSEMALSDMPGLALMLAAMGFLLHGKDWRGHFIIGCVLTGLTLGLRPHNALPLAFTGLYALWQIIDTHPRRQALITISAGFAAGIAGIAVWLLPTAQAFGGMDGYLASIDTHRAHVQQNDSLFRGEITGDSLRDRLDAYTTGWAALLAGERGQPLLLVAGLLLVGLVRVPFRTRAGMFTLLWLVAAGLMVLLVVSLERPRLYLPALIPLILLAAYGYTQYRTRLLRWTPMLLLPVLLSLTAPLAFRLQDEAAPPVQAALYLRENYAPQPAQAVVVSQGSFKAAQYYLGQHHQLYTPFFNADAWAQDLRNRQPETLFVFDGDDIGAAVFDAITAPWDYVSVDDRVFERDRRVFPQHVTVRVQVFVPRDRLTADRLALPANGQITSSDPAHSKHFGTGWFRAEMIGEVAGRWAGETAELRVTLPPQAVTLTFQAAPFGDAQSVTVFVNDEAVETLPLDVVWGEYRVTIPAEAITGHAITTITLQHARAGIPAGSTRQLAAAYSRFTFSPPR